MDTSPNTDGLFQEEGQGPFVYRSYEELLLREVFYLINAVTQSCPTDSSITIYEAESGVISASIYESEFGVISDPDKIPHWHVLVSSILASWIEMISGFCSRTKLESFLRLITFRKTPTDLNPSERRQVACCDRGLKDALLANFDHARRKIQRLKKIH